MCRITYILCDGCVTLSVTGKEPCPHPGSKSDGCKIEWVFDPADPVDCAECAENEARAQEGEGKAEGGEGKAETCERTVIVRGNMVGGGDGKKDEGAAEAPKSMDIGRKGKEKAEVKGKGKSKKEKEN